MPKNHHTPKRGRIYQYSPLQRYGIKTLGRIASSPHTWSTAGKVVKWAGKKLFSKQIQKRHAIHVEEALQHGEVVKFYKTIKITGAHQRGEGGCMIAQWDLFGTQTSGSGTQAASTFIYLNMPQMYMNTTTNTSPMKYESPVGFYDLCAYQATTNPVGPAAAIVARPLNQLIHLRNIILRLTITNWASTEATIQIYILRSKKSQDISVLTPEGLWDRGYSDSGLGQIVAVQRALATAAVSGFGKKEFLYANPKDSEVFKSNWAIEHMQQVRLTSGNSTAELTMNLKYHKTYKRDVIQNIMDAVANVSPAPNVVMPGTLAIMVVQKGCSVGKTTVDNSAAISPTSIGWVANTKYIFQNAKGRAVTEPTIRNFTEFEYANAVNTKQINDLDAQQNDVEIA